MSNPKIRLDQLLLERGFFPSRTQAQAAIMAGEIFSDDQLLSKPGQLVKHDLPLSLKSRRPRFVSRGGYKLEGALKDFNLSVEGRICLDLGSSTGGFTDCLLQRGASRVVAVDVGRNQMNERLRLDPRVDLREEVNARYLKPGDLPGLFDLVVIDVSFISIAKMLPLAAAVIQPRTGCVLGLIKPQFEVGPAGIGKGGIVRDEKIRDQAVKKIVDRLPEWGLKKLGLHRSRLTGADGNQEFFIWAGRAPQ